MSHQATFTHEVPEGWYPDPANPELQRWWAGSQWTDHVRHSDGKPDPQFAMNAAFAAHPIYAAPSHAEPSNAMQISYLDEPTYLDDRRVSSASTPWHIVTPEPEVTRYVPMSNHYSPTNVRGEMWNPRPYSPNTAAIWLVALSPLLWVMAEWIGSTLGAGGNGATRSLAISGSLFVVLLLAAVTDSRELRRRNLSAPSIGWFFLGIVPYFFARWFTLMRDGTRHAAPGIVFVVALVACAVAWVLVLGPNAVV